MSASNPDGLITDAGRALRAQLLAGESVPGLFWFAFGNGSWVDKQNPDPEQQAATGLTSEYGRKIRTRYAYLQLDNVNGTISFKGNKYKEVTGPTPIVAFYGDLTESEAVGLSICEEALFGGTVVTSATPFALVVQVQSPGTLYWVRNRPEIIKTAEDTYSVLAIFDNSVA